MMQAFVDPSTRLAWIVGAAVALTHVTSVSAGDAEVEAIVPGAVTPPPGKSTLPRRERMANLAVGASLLAGNDNLGGEVFAAFRLAESIGVGGGVVADSSGTAAFVRLDALGLAINHWAFIASADYLIDDGWRFGGAMVVPVRRDSYLRLSINTDGDAAWFGVGGEHDVW